MIKAKYNTTLEIFFWSALIAILSGVFLYDNAFVVGFIFSASFFWLKEYYHISKKQIDKDEE